MIASIAKKLGTNIKSYTLSFEEESFDRSYKATCVSEYLNITNEQFVISKNELSNIDEIILSFGEPLSDTSIIPTYFLSKHVGKKVKVCLGGDGGDELFFGYDTYSASKTYDIINKSNLNFIFENLQFLKNLLPIRKLKLIYFML